jgi:hypothetical protein
MTHFPTLKPLPAREIVSRSAELLGNPGVYLVLFDPKAQLLERSGYYDFDRSKPLATPDGYQLLYAGASRDPLRRRVLEHLTGNTKGSSLRMTIGALIGNELGLDPVGSRNRTYFDFGDGEQRLTDWMLAHTRVAVVATDDPFPLERAVLATTPVPLNISERRRHPYSKFLMNLRAVLACRRPSTVRVMPTGTWASA